ncbi:hypothetical protein [Singulisphaera acidiphila]|uniref:Uncharacterized protein n=1 Tax=Singulisphaera acidiphila (strain ATCC BAA-1392 / DSM 18658 / VKM B-2454 / MOB10) TaxID=886293 RepID=L0DAR1_SINAD|nr:hypothetical protein [Singulisphaera acidiphila]AGA25930.1 hypothetical protein Sinac_1551 [Singulisphaera acidiphila DSM 18658]
MESHSHPPHQNLPGRRFPVLPIVTPDSTPDTSGFIFPGLPIVTPDPPRLSQREKYGALFYVGLFGLAVLIGLIGWFAHGAWSLRDVWSNVYVLHDDSRPEVDRVRAALALSRDSRVNQRQRWDICLRTPLPALARYVLAESLTAEAASADPRGYALTVARSPDWPVWLRVLLTRPMAYAAVDGVKFPAVALEELKGNPDRGIALWASFVLTQLDLNDRAGPQVLVAGCEGSGWERELACLLLEASRLKGRPDEQKRLLDQATAWLRAHHPESKPLWSQPGLKSP